MNPAVILCILAFLAFGIMVFLFNTRSRRIIELKDKTSFAIKSDALVKVELPGNDHASVIAQNFNVLGEKLNSFKKSSSELNEIKSEKKQLDQKLHNFEDSLSQLNLLTDIGRKITSCLNIKDIQLKLFNYITASMVVDEVNIMIVKNGKQIYYSVNNGKVDEINDAAWCNDKDNILNWTFENNKEIYLNEASKDFAQYVYKPLKMRDGQPVESAICVPLGISVKMIGACSVLCGTKNSFSDFHLDFARSLASYVSVAIDNANLYGELDEEKQKSEELLLNILPKDVADELKNKGHSDARDYEWVTVMFTDFKDFTRISEQLSPAKIVEELNYCFTEFDKIIRNHGIEKIKTIGDAYMCAGGLPVRNITHAKDVVAASIEIRKFMTELNNNKKANGEIPFEIRIGINTGHVVAGIVGLYKFAFDIWGDAVNIAARMEQNSQAGKINISGATYELVKDEIKCNYRGKIEAKNKGMIDMYFVE